MLVVSTIRHPIPRFHQLVMLLDMFDSRETLAIIVPKGEGHNRIASLRSLLSKQRLEMRKNKTRYTDFGTYSYVMPWTEPDGTVHEAILLRIHRDTRHVVKTIFQQRRID